MVMDFKRQFALAMLVPTRMSTTRMDLEICPCFLKNSVYFGAAVLFEFIEEEKRYDQFMSVDISVCSN